MSRSRRVGRAPPHREVFLTRPEKGGQCKTTERCAVHHHTKMCRTEPHRERFFRPTLECDLTVSGWCTAKQRSVWCTATQRGCGARSHRECVGMATQSVAGTATHKCAVPLHTEGERRTATQRCAVCRRGVSSAEPHRGVRCTTTPRSATQSHTKSAGVGRVQPQRR